MRLRVAQGHDLKTRRRLASPSAAAAANVAAACSTGFSVRRATATAKAWVCDSERRANRLGENGREAIVFRRHDEQGLSGDRLGQKGVVGAARFQ
jgi:hypothetical protein